MTRQMTEQDKVKVMIVDDHPIVRQGIKMLISQEPDLAVSGEAESASEALQVMSQQTPDIAIVDLALKESSGLELIKDVRIRYPDVDVLVLSMRDESFYAERVLRAGAKGYIVKEEGTEKVIEGIRKIRTGDIYLSERMASKLISKYVDGGAAMHEGPAVQNLTDRELEVFEMLGKGLTTREIAQKLHLSIKTIESHREHIKTKLRIDNATELLKHAIQWVQYQEGE